MNHDLMWTHHHPVRILAGPGTFSRLQDTTSLSGKILLVTSPGFSLRGTVEKALTMLGRDRVTVHDNISPNPDLDDLDEYIKLYRSLNVSDIVALGGGSVLDTAKILGAMMPQPEHTSLDAIFRKGYSLTSAGSITVTAVATTSGTGAEVTPFATVWDKVGKKKFSLSGNHICPAHAILDPKLTLTLPRRETLHTSLDAISHALESLWNKNRTPVSEAWALHALKLAGVALPVILEQPENLERRAGMQQASLLAGLAISKTKTSIAHAISYPLTIHYGIPHGLACSFALPALIRRYSRGLEDGMEKQLLRLTEETLDKAGLKTETFRYFADLDVQEHVNEILMSERSDNYIFPMEEPAMAELLRETASDG